MKRLYEAPAYDTARWPDSWWRASVAAIPDHAPLPGLAETEVAIIGAGVTGLNAALELAERFGTAATVLDAGQPGWGASGRNGGFACLGGAKIDDATILARHGAEVLRAFHAFRMAGIDRVADNLDRYRIDADRQPTGEIALAHRPAAMAELDREAALLSDVLGLETERLAPEALAERGLGPSVFHGGIRIGCGFGLHPLKYVLGLAGAAIAAGVKLHGQSPVTAIRPAGNRWRLETPQGSLTADRVILATNGYTAEDIPPALAGRVLPAFSSILVTRPLTTAERSAAGWQSPLIAFDSRTLLHYFRLLPDGRFLFGMRGGLSARTGAQAAIRRMARRHLEALFPAWAHVETPYFWSGLIALTWRLAPSIAALPGRPGLFAALGYHGNGVAAGSEAGRRVARCAMGAEAAIPALLARPPARFPLAPLRRAGLGAAYLRYRLADGPVSA